ncbi:MAG: carboxypeptidase-like regulatory domain-containing protein [Muribaculaceae bacterium]|nr:carboxypeptidase-like regulatory domain-containing protein [Muribaculaceae bacterium]
MKHFLILFIFLLSAICVKGEEKTPTATGETEYYRVVGAVIDTWGNPIPGALVKSKNGMEAVTEFDGTFSIFLAPGDDKLTASYPGLSSKKKGIKEQPVVFELAQKPVPSGHRPVVPDGQISVTFTNH